MFIKAIFHFIKIFLLLFYFVWSAWGNYAAYSAGVDFDDTVSGDADTSGYITATAVDEGVDMFGIGAQYPGYHYGPSMILNGDGTLDVWTATQATFGMWDVIRHAQTPDGGKTRTDEIIALAPTAGGEDALSTCDPGVIKIGEYYYIGYTSTLDERGTDNNVYIARSTSARGPFTEKWTGDGWGILPAPVIRFDGNTDQFGIGEPSFVLMEDTIFVYYSLCDESGATTHVATASIFDDKWPSRLVDHGLCIPSKDGGDSTDVKYLDEYGRFVAVFTEKRFSEDSYVAVWESFDGFSFRRASAIKTNTARYLHNCGISGRSNGHIAAGDPVYLAYGYGPQWGEWALRMQRIEFSTSAEVDTSQLKGENVLVQPTVNKTRACSDVMGLFTREQVFNIKGMRIITMWVYDSDGYTLPVVGARFDGYDRSVVRRIGNLFFVVGDGTTRVTAHWYDYSYDFVINAGDSSEE